MTFIEFISRLPSGAVIVLHWRDGQRVRAELTTIAESDNGLDYDEDGYQEFYAAYFKALDILNPHEETEITLGSLFELSEHAPIHKITDDANGILWKAQVSAHS